MKTQIGEKLCQCYLADQRLHGLLEKVDSDLAQEAKEKGCGRCGAKLHCDDYDRKPRGGPTHWNKRRSFTCAEKRHRLTPASVRFLGQFVQSAFWKAARARFMPSVCELTLPLSLCAAFGVDRRDRLLDLLKFLSPITTGSDSSERMI